jgi:3-phosphoinositide dependent protein kinase-1
LGDFGCCIDTSKDKPKSFVGTAQYLCPEILKDPKTASKASDYWSIGCSLYFFVSSNFPFKGKSEYLIMKCVEKGEFSFPDFLVDENLKDLITNLLVSDPVQRLSDFNLIKSHPFFQSIVWDNIFRQNAPKPENIKDEKKQGN